MITFTFDGIEFTAKSFKHAKSLVTKHMQHVGKSIYDFTDAKTCFYSDNLQAIHYHVNDSGLQISKPYGRACKQRGCKCKCLNAVSREYMKNCLELSDDEITRRLKDKGERSYTSALKNGSNNPFARAACGDNPMSYASLVNSGMTIGEAKEFLSKKGKLSSDTLRERGWYDDQSNNPFSKAFWIKKGLTEEEAQSKVNSRNFWVTGDIPNPGKFEYWENKIGGEDLWRDKIRRSSHSNTLVGRIEKYGEDEGTSRHKAALANRKYSGSVHSREATKFFISLYKALRKVGFQRSDIQFSINGGELKLSNGVKNFYYDFTVGNKIIEYNGFIWHPRRHMMSEQEYEAWRNPYLRDAGPRANDVEAKDAEKVYIAEQLGYNVLEIWSHDVAANKDDVLNKCMRFIHEKTTSN